MTRNALVVGDGFVVDQPALGRIETGNNHAARTFPIRRAQDVVGRGGFGELGIGSTVTGDFATIQIVPCSFGSI